MTEGGPKERALGETGFPMGQFGDIIRIEALTGFLGLSYTFFCARSYVRHSSALLRAWSLFVTYCTPHERKSLLYSFARGFLLPPLA